MYLEMKYNYQASLLGLSIVQRTSNLSITLLNYASYSNYPSSS